MENSDENVRISVAMLRNKLLQRQGVSNSLVDENFTQNLAAKGDDPFSDGFHDRNGPFGDHFNDKTDPFHDSFHDQP